MLPIWCSSDLSLDNDDEDDDIMKNKTPTTSKTAIKLIDPLIIHIWIFYNFSSRSLQSDYLLLK